MNGEDTVPASIHTESDLLSDSQRARPAPKAYSPEQPLSPLAAPVKTVSVFDEARNGNFLPAFLLLKTHPEMKFDVLDNRGYSLCHYAVCLGNLQALRLFLAHDPDCFKRVSSTKQDSLMTAINYNNGPIISYILNNSIGHPLENLDNWGFTSVTYTIKNNCLMAFVYLLTKGASLNKSIVDSNKCSYAHWACFTDRKFMLTMLFRADVDFMGRDVIDMTPWDRAVENWSIFCIGFMLDYNLRPLRTLYHLKGDKTFPIFELIPETTKTVGKDVSSHYIPLKLAHFDRIRRGVYDSLSSLFSDNKGLHLLSFISHWWLHRNIVSRLWFKTYLGIVLVLIAHVIFLMGSSSGLYGHGEPQGQSQSPPEEAFGIVYTVLLVLCVAQTVRLCFKFGSVSPMSVHFESRPRRQREGKDPIEDRLFPEYYLQPREYSDYLEMYSPGDSLWDSIVGMINRGEWNDLNTVNEAEYCGMCGIRKKRKTRHCPNVNLCIPKYHKYSHFFDMPVYFANELLYYSFLSFETVSLQLYFNAFFRYFGSRCLDNGWSFKFPTMLYLHWLQGNHFTVFLALLVFWTLLVKYFNLGLFTYCILKNLTVDEVMNAQLYPYLFKEKSNIEGKYYFINKADKGLWPNLVHFFRQSTSTRAIY